jgi:putative methionine-R-sulfoxide reductase with GAF domain
MQGSFTARDVTFLSLPTATFCVQCELISSNNTPCCLACGSTAVLSRSRILGGSLKNQQTAHVIADAELDQLVRSLLGSVPVLGGSASRFDQPDPSSIETASLGAVSRHHLRRRTGPVAMESDHGVRCVELDPAELDLEPGISIIAEKAQSLTRATGAAVALRKGDEIVCRARTGRTAPDIGVRLQTDSGLSADCVRTGEVLLCHDAESNPRVDLASSRRLGVRSILVAPLRHLRRTIGVFEVLSSAPYAFDRNDVATMQFLSGMVVSAISRLSSLRPEPGSMAGD